MKNQSTYPLRLPRSVKAEVERRAKQTASASTSSSRPRLPRSWPPWVPRSFLPSGEERADFYRFRPAHAAQRRRGSGARRYGRLSR